MDLDEAIQHCEEVADTPCFTDEETKCYSEHRQLAEWLKELKAYREQSGDAISREDILDYIAKLLSGYLYEEERERLENFTAYIAELPSVTPRQKMGRWIQKEEEGEAEPFIIWECSECHCVDEDGKPSYKYCPQCGAKMEVEG